MGTDRYFRWGILILLAVIWGSSFILMKIGLREIPFEQLGALRMFIAFLALTPFGILKWKHIERRYWKYLLIVGICGNGIPAFLFAYAQTFINSSLAGMLNSLVPLFTLILGALFFQSKSKNIQITGVIAGLIGASFLLYRPGITFHSNSWHGLYIVFATICYGISVNVIKRHLSEISSPVITSTALLFIGPLCGIYLLIGTDFISSFSMNYNYLYSFGAVMVLSVLATGFAIIMFNMLIKRVSALYASSVTYLIPVIAILWGVIDGESIAAFQIIGMTAIFTGVYLINSRP